MRRHCARKARAPVFEPRPDAPAPNISSKAPDVSGIVASISELSAVETVSLWRNAVKKLGDKSRVAWHPAARLVLRAVQDEWERREAELLASEDGFPWPSTRAPRGLGAIDSAGWLKEGMLSFMGYRVGSTNGMEVDERQQLLAAIFDGPLPPVFPRRYMAEWSRPSAPGRLRKMAETLAAFARNGKRRDDAAMDQAVEDWEEDLDFLFHEFYRGRFGFAWPRVQIDFER